ncbi:MAG TPA: phosphotransferase [Allosphingosinicella sp.]|nr:phosphotransferase [Allosphingosinicella sp.]
METIFRNLVRYLVGERLLTEEAVVDGGLALAMSRSRNRYVLVKQRNGPCYFVKQAMETEAMTAETVAREAEVYRGVYGDDRLAALRDLLPNFHLFDPAQGILVTELVRDADTLAACHLGLGACPPALAARLGTALATYHQVRFAEGKPQAALFPQTPPWIFKLHSEPDTRTLRRSKAAAAMVDMLLEAPGLGEQLAALQGAWRRDTLIHTDMRWENVLLAPRTAPLDERRLVIVDWELADIGDAAWDVGGMFQAYLNFWILSMPPDAGPAPEARAAAATRPLESIRPAIAAFSDAYLDASEAYGDTPAPFLERATAMMGARMLVTAFEMSAWSETLPPHAVMIAQTGLNVLQAPADAARDLLGLDLADRPVPADRERRRA